MKPSCPPSARDKRFARDLHAVLVKLAREKKPLPPARPAAPAGKKSRRG